MPLDTPDGGQRLLGRGRRGTTPRSGASSVVGKFTIRLATVDSLIDVIGTSACGVQVAILTRIDRTGTLAVAEVGCSINAARFSQTPANAWISEQTGRAAANRCQGA